MIFGELKDDRWMGETSNQKTGNRDQVSQGI